MTGRSTKGRRFALAPFARASLAVAVASVAASVLISPTPATALDRSGAMVPGARIEVPNRAGIGYGPHALRPPRHDLRAPHLAAPNGEEMDMAVPAMRLRRGARRLPSRSSSRLARHVNWCRTRYRSYDARTDTFVPARNAARRACQSPFSPN